MVELVPLLVDAEKRVHCPRQSPVPPLQPLMWGRRCLGMGSLFPGGEVCQQVFEKLLLVQRGAA